MLVRGLQRSETRRKQNFRANSRSERRSIDNGLIVAFRSAKVAINRFFRGAKGECACEGV